MENISNSEPEINLSSNNKSNFINFKNKKVKIIIISIILFSILISFILFLIQKTKLSKTELNQNSKINSNSNYNSNPNINSNPIISSHSDISTTSDNQIKSGWLKYRNDVLGIEFNYPESWGEILLSPNRNITHLNSINKDFLESKDNDYRYMVKIQFSKNSYVNFNFINNQYLGEKYPNGYAYQYGPMDNFEILKKTQDICQYRFDFKNTVNGRNVSFIESDNKCKDNIKTTLFFENPDAKNSNNEKYFNYQIKQYFYKKLNNGYFDNLLISNFLASYQGSESNLNFDQIISKNSQKISYELSTSNFKKFVDSIKIFNPPAIKLLTSPQNSNSQDPNIKTIYQYYFYLANQKLSEAYDMYSNKNISFKEFNNWYNQVFYTNVYNIKLISQNKYQFNVDIYEENQSVSKYLVVMEVNNNKINTLSSEERFNDEVKFGEYSAYVRRRLGKNEVVLVKNGIQKVIDSGNVSWKTSEELGNLKDFTDLRFSPKGTYLIYYSIGWEWGSPNFYDVTKNHGINIDLSYADIILTDDEKYLFSCTSAGIGSGVSAIIYSGPDFSIKKDFQNTINNLTFDPIIRSYNVPPNFEPFPVEAKCSYSPEKSEFIITITNSDEQQRTIEYNLNTNQETIK